MRSKALAMTLAVFLAACSSPFGPNEALLLSAARAQWEQRGFTDYTFVARHGCFCTPEQVGPVRITVRGGVLVSAALIETGDAVDLAYWFTIEQLFDRIPESAKYEGVEDVRVEYDPTLGFPSSVQVRYGEDHLDAGDTYTLSDVTPA
jgi:Family of unknown function (DUF6174)